MALILDTSAVIGLTERRDERLERIVRKERTASIRSPFVLAELRHGAGLDVGTETAQVGRRRTLRAYLRMTAQPSVWNAWAIGDRFVELTLHAAAASSANQLKVGQHDRWIIAEAVQQRARLVTCDRMQAELARSWSVESGSDFDVEFVAAEIS